jgi:hypothetical protein
VLKPDNIIVPLIEEGLDKRHIPFTAEWFPHSAARPFRYSFLLDGGIPALVELGVPKHGLQSVEWALWPAASDVEFEFERSGVWPGKAWGSAIIDRQLNFAVMVSAPMHCRRSVRSRLLSLPNRSVDELRLTIGWAA